MRFLIFAGLFVASTAFAQNTNSPVYLVNTNLTLTPVACSAPVNSATLLNTDGGLPAPATPLSGRRLITVCNSAENTSGTVVKLRVDGTKPAIGSGAPGDVLLVGSCVSYNLPSLVDGGVVNVLAITNTASTYVTTLECK